MFVRFFYTCGIKLYSFLILIAGLFGNNKAKLWIDGRKRWKNDLTNLNSNKKKLTWFHVASLGEFEQARPLIEKLRIHEPSSFILVSFFSPSGFEVRKNYNLADQVIYLPADTLKNAKNFIRLTNPIRVFFVKYDFWFNYLSEIKRNNIDCYLICGIFRKEQHFFRPYGNWFRIHLNAFSHMFVQNQESLDLLKSIGYHEVSIAGDTRLDRVRTIANENFSDKRFETFCKDKDVIIFGSSWEKEEELAVNLAKNEKEIKVIIVPHEIRSEKILDLNNKFSNSCKLLSETDLNEDLSSINTLIIDQMGLLSKIYRYAKIACIGGGFGSGIHNTLEAVIYGCPVIFGPNYHKFQEAHDLISLGAGFSFRSQDDFQTIVSNLIDNELSFSDAVDGANKYIHLNSGATESIINYLIQKK